MAQCSLEKPISLECKLGDQPVLVDQIVLVKLLLMEYPIVVKQFFKHAHTTKMEVNIASNSEVTRDSV